MRCSLFFCNFYGFFGAVLGTDLSDAGSLPRSRNGSSTRKSSSGKCPQSAPSSALSSRMENLGNQVTEEKDLSFYEPVTNESKYYADTDFMYLE